MIPKIYAGGAGEGGALSFVFTHGGVSYGVSCSHVLRPSTTIGYQAPIFIEGYQRIIGSLYRWTEFDYDHCNHFDLGIFKLAVEPGFFSPMAAIFDSYFAIKQATITPRIGETVATSLPSSPSAVGQIIRTGVPRSLSFSQLGSVCLSNLIEIGGALSRPGDSGGLIFKEGTQNPIGFILGNGTDENGSYTAILPMSAFFNFINA
jgi:hypothetical protein